MAKYRKLGRTSSQRKALLRNQVTALLNNGKIKTTEAKAKEIRKIAEDVYKRQSLSSFLQLRFRSWKRCRKMVKTEERNLQKLPGILQLYLL